MKEIRILSTLTPEEVFWELKFAAFSRILFEIKAKRALALLKKVVKK